MHRRFTRRSFIMLPALAGLDGLSRLRESNPHWFHADGVLGTSMDLVVRTKDGASDTFADAVAERVQAEIRRLCGILSTYHPESEIRRFERIHGSIPSAELAEIFALYERWETATGGILSIRPLGPGSALNVDALGKAYILDKAAAAGWHGGSGLEGLLLNIGGDIVVLGSACDADIADPARAFDNAAPIARTRVENAAIATSGSYARGSHLLDARTGFRPAAAASATVMAADAVTANAVATAMCVASEEESFDLVRRTPGVQALRISPEGTLRQTPDFARLARYRKVQAAGGWPAGFEVTISLTLTTPDPRLDRSYVAFWVEDPAGKLVRAIVLWGNKAEYHPDMTGFWSITGGSKELLYKLTRATRAPGAYKVVWNGMDDGGKAVPRGTYRIVVETNRYRGTYAKASGLLACESEPAGITLQGSVNYGAITVQYGPKAPQA